MRDIATLRTARLVLRPFRTEDAEDIAAAVANYDVARWLAVIPFPYGRVDAEAFLGSTAAEARRSWAVCNADGLVGAISVSGELGFWLARPFWGRGYLTEAGAAVVDAAFADPSRHHLVASHMIGNDRSARVLEKLGFRQTAIETRHFVALGQEAPVRRLVMTRREWRRLRGRSRWSIAG